ncbi:MAG: hypothetical protein JNN18_18765 [Rubrivivax sp.]|jgi:hypothetical protein|nr:hypothetical protein [Rubrivivax sp.]
MSKVELKKKWWIGVKPKTVKGAELEKALALVESTEDEKLVAALATLKPALAKARAELKGQKDLLKDLDTLESMAEAEVKKVQAEMAKAKAAAAKAAEKAAEKEKAKEDDGGDDEDEETAGEKLFDPELHRTTLKRATRQALPFAFVVSNKAEVRALALGVRGMPKSMGRKAKERSDGAKVVFGRLQAAPGEATKLMISLEDCPNVPGAAKQLRLYLKQNKINLYKKFAVLLNGQEQEVDEDDEGGAPEAGADASGAAAVAASGAAASQAAPQAPAAGAAQAAQAQQEQQVLEDRRREFKRARAAWVAAKVRAEQDLEKVKDGAKMAYMADAQQWPKVVAGCKAIDDILDNLDDELRDTLDQYASTPLRNQKKLEALAGTAAEVLERYQRFVANNALMRAIDEKEFADVQVHAPVTKALADLRKALA